MCGITGLLRLGFTSPPCDRGLLDRMTDSLAHRGPDDRGTWADDRVALGHRRLSIIDLSRAGRQPMGNEDGSLQIAYNGEIYNFRELKRMHALVERGHCFRSRTDTEVILHLFEEIGLAMVPELNGIFAIALWDQRRQLLHLIRDPYGVKPLFYQKDADYFRFGSEIKAILQDPRVPRRPDLQALHDFLTFDYIPGEQTAFEGIFEVPPGHWMTVDTAGSVRFQRYWDPSFAADPSLDEATAVRSAAELMDLALQRQLVSDVPIGVMLSGGMDSSALVALMNRHVSEPVHTFSVGFEDATFNELPFARIVAEKYRTVHREVVVTAERARALLPRYLTYIDEPYADGSAIPTYYVCELAKEAVTVVLSGEGADEAFAGYDTYAAYRASQWFKRVPRWLARGVVAPLVHRMPVSYGKLSLEFRLKRFLGGQDLPPALAHLWWRVVLTESEKLGLYSAQVLERLAPSDSARHFLEPFGRPGPTDDLSRLLRLDASVFLPDDLMIKNDRMSMAHSLEARVPFTDPDLTNFMARVPSEVKLPGLRKKHVMRRALAGLLPREILEKKKVGLELPYSRWFRHEFRDLVLDSLGAERIASTGLFRPEAVGRLVKEHLEGRRDHGRALWGLLNYVMWLDLYIPGGGLS